MKKKRGLSRSYLQAFHDRVKPWFSRYLSGIAGRIGLQARGEAGGRSKGTPGLEKVALQSLTAASVKNLSDEDLLTLHRRCHQAAAKGDKEMALGEGRGVGGPRQGVGGTDTCICPECKWETKHDRGTPCAEMKCEKCGVAMVGKEEKWFQSSRGRGKGGA
ncbi:MAG TPA: hypothetical protein VNA25_30300 [Phycisphaerae bacterium]|nr:hypothetical protein [Phycisphaerae bacterium]